MSSIMSNEAAMCLRRSLWQFSWLQFVRHCSCKREIPNDRASVKQQPTVKSEKASKSSKSHERDFNKSELDVKGNAKRLTEFPKSFHGPAAFRMAKRPEINLPTGTSRKQDDAGFIQVSRNISKVTYTRSNSKPNRVRNLEFLNLRDDDFTKRKMPKISQPLDRERGSEMLFGIAPCSLALSQSRRKVFKLFVKENRSWRTEMQGIYERVREIGVPVRQVMRKVLDRLCEGQVHQGICLEVTPLDYVNYDQCYSTDIDGPAFERSDRPILWLALEGIQDPMNMGAVLRSAHFLGADLVLVSQQNSCSLTPTVSKASAGVVEVMTVYCTPSLPQVLKAKAAQGWQIVGTVGKSTKDASAPIIPCAQFQWNKQTILVLGNEGFGLSDEIESLCNAMLTIPAGRSLQPGIESLNVSVAAGTTKRMLTTWIFMLILLWRRGSSSLVVHLSSLRGCLERSFFAYPDLSYHRPSFFTTSPKGILLSAK
ncbi:rRNA methyltransferase 1, mitochondrial isoform X2 [Carcharodon carcharias]|uniref:rRNA methyltransferase 1, mitochondrial isoform X2 n=1 Tax=Carcharodon carcharias TaxID=13397 RepID=UPI001B7EDEB1|nr:rRNA methyltransferase 1, mitochondrial isoform X2 [Carcharodon carcharias]